MWAAAFLLLASALFVANVRAGGVKEPHSLNVTGDVIGVHDPSLGKSGDTYYLYTTGAGIPVRSSTDLRVWHDAGRVFAIMPGWAAKDIPGADSIWAPDISYVNGQYRLYYAVSTFGSNRSDIGLATNTTLDPKNPDYKWVDRGVVIASRPTDNWNAIDPNFVVDENGGQWLVFGSFWGGIKLVRLDPKTGKPADPGKEPIGIAYRLEVPHAIEAPYIIHHGGYYYLFASFDFCCRGVNSTYNVRVGRSAAITGPYVDKEGQSMADGGGTRVLSGTTDWKGPGGESLYKDGSGQWWIVYHSYSAQLAGAPELRIDRVVWRGGWPVVMSPDVAKQ